MVTTRDITDHYKDERITIDVVLHDANGDPLPTAGLSVQMVASLTPGGANVWDQPLDLTLTDAPTATYRAVLDPATDLATFAEGAARYYAIWSTLDADPPVLRAVGQITLKNSISLSGS